ncbi:MAG: hypothetical protein PHS93_08625 [Candidatus Omnitrophica bacterium]|nr:hypothetical protein [Candidatus Omnitrophota bacterium]
MAEIKEVFVVSPITHVLIIPKTKHYSNTEELTFNFQAKVPLKVPEDIAEGKVKIFPNKYKIVTNAEAEKLLKVKPVQQVKPEEVPEVVFDAIEWLNQNHPVEKEKLELLELPELFQIVQALSTDPKIKLNIHPNIGKDKLVLRLLTAIEELEKDENG